MPYAERAVSIRRGAAARPARGLRGQDGQGVPLPRRRRPLSGAGALRQPPLRRAGHRQPCQQHQPLQPAGGKGRHRRARSAGRQERLFPKSPRRRRGRASRAGRVPDGPARRANAGSHAPRSGARKDQARRPRDLPGGWREHPRTSGAGRMVAGVPRPVHGDAEQGKEPLPDHRAADRAHGDRSPHQRPRPGGRTSARRRPDLL